MFALLLHFTLVLVYANPLASGQNKISFLARAYVYPFFHQNWNLFAPAPDSNYRLFALYEDKGPQRVDVFGEIVTRHQSNRLAGYEPLVIAFSNSLHYFEKNTALQQNLNGPVKNDLNFTLLEQATRHYLQHTRQLSIARLRLILVVENTQTKTSRVYFN